MHIISLAAIFWPACPLPAAQALGARTSLAEEAPPETTTIRTRITETRKGGASWTPRPAPDVGRQLDRRDGLAVKQPEGCPPEQAATVG